ncbi:MAG: outer membrane beta-barrel protein [Pseudomonadales bacterium]|nr:outer membrane beta-barrel protein [Pseudomonadales bacterium]
MRKNILATAAVIGFGLTAGSVQAHEAGDFILRLGAATVAPDESNNDLKLNGAVLGATAGGDLSVDNNTQLGITGTYMFTDHIGLGVLAATPFDHEIKGDSTIQGALATKNIGSTKHLPPTVTAQYFFNDKEATVQPYVGVGVNYNVFFDEDVHSGLETALGGKSKMSLDDSWGLALEAGVDITVSENLLVNLSVWNLDIDTEATIKSPAGKVTADVDIDPWVYMVGVGYKF